MTGALLDPSQWARETFGDCQLGDQRRTKRLVRYAEQVAACSEGSTPLQTESWAACKAAYRLFNQEEVSFAAVCRPHWQQTQNCPAGRYLLLGDTTVINYGYEPSVQGLSPVGDGTQRGFHVHSSLMIEAESEQVLGLAGAEIFHRTPQPKGQTTREKKNRRRESEIWGQVIDQVGPPRPGVRWIHVFDAGADNFEVFCHLREQEVGWIVRAAQQHRVVEDAQGTRRKLSEVLQQAPVAGQQTFSLARRKQQPAREATLEIRYAPLAMPLPAQPTPYMKQCGVTKIPMMAIQIRELEPPAGTQPIQWLLLTSEPVESLAEAVGLIRDYQKRWRVEEYHQCLKTGCRVEGRPYKTSARLERVTGVLCLVAVRLLQLKFAARHQPPQPAETFVPPDWLNLLRELRGNRPCLETTQEFLRELAQFGGFLGRKRDGQPGWQTLWRGLTKLLLCLRGANWALGKCG